MAQIRWKEGKRAVFTDMKILWYYDFSFSRIVRKSNFSGSDLKYSRFYNYNLQDADFSKADLKYCDFSNADVKGAIFKGARLHGSDMRWAKNLKQEQIDQAYGDRFTKVPEGMEKVELCLEKDKEPEKEMQLRGQSVR